MNYSDTIKSSTDIDLIHILSPQMLVGYYNWIRPDYISPDAEDDGRFFLNTSGRPIKSATNDLSRLHAQ